MEKFIPVEDAVLRDTFWNAAIDLKKENDELKQHNNELEKRLLALWEKYHGDSNYYIGRIKRLEKAGDDLESWLDRKTPFTIRNNWREAKEIKP